MIPIISKPTFIDPAPLAAVKSLSLFGAVNTNNAVVTNHPANGIKYVKRISDTQYFVFDDERMYEPTDTSSLRSVSGVTWTHYGSTQDLTGSWRYYTTLFSPNGLNGQSVFKDDMLIPTDHTFSAPTSETVVDYDGTSVVADKYRFGQSVDCLLYTSPSPRDVEESRMPSSA